MFLDFFDKQFGLFAKRSAAALLIVSLLVMSSPAPLVFADETGGDSGAAAPSDNGGDTGDTGGSGDSGSGGSGGDTGSGGDGGEGSGSGDTGGGGDTGSGEGHDGATPGDEQGDGADGEDTEHGEEGADGGQPNPPADGEETLDTVIETGNAVSTTDTENEINANITNTGGGADEEEKETASTTPEVTEETGSTTPETLDTEAGSTTPSTASSTPSVNSASTTVTNINDANASTSATTTATTGENEAASEEGNVFIDTGHALASANVINVVNTNIINSFGFLILLSALFGNSSFDLRALDFTSWLHSTPAATDTSEGGESSEDGSVPCSLVICGEDGTTLTVTSSSTAAISNDVVVRAETGGNTAEADGGSAAVSTGDAYASANVVNVANTNIIDSNYLLVSLNNFGDFSGDIVFPGIEFFQQLLSQEGSTAANVNVTNSNAATTTNSVSVGADTGGNSATSTEDAVIETGDATADANVVNQVNTNLFGGNSLYILLRVHGDWSGNIFGLPPGLAWEETPQGIAIYSTGDGGDALPKYKSLTSNNTNDATIENNVSVYALTGDNKVEGANGAYIETGNAQAGANIINVANTNVIGQNWMLAVFNIFGNWSGNLSFGRPDLWVGGRAESPNNPLNPGSVVTYHFTVTNFGDAEATDVVLTNTYNDALLSFGEEGDTWHIGDLSPGESGEYTYTAKITDDLNYGESPVELETAASSNETDNNLEDNTERLSLVAYRVLPFYPGGTRYGKGFGPYAENYYDHANLVLTKEASVMETTASSTVDYTVTIQNDGDSAEDAMLVDVLLDPSGEETARQYWDLGEIYPDEEIVVTYTVVYDAETLSGEYINEAQVIAQDERSQKSNKYGSANSNVARSSVMVRGLEALIKACEPLLTSYLRYGRENNEEDVKKLQDFLREHEGFDVETTGEFDRATLDAVHFFQRRYADDVLYAWGVRESSGYVYYTTQKKINDLYCEGEIAFPLTSTQLTEIATFRTKLEQARGGAGDPPDPTEVGQVQEEAVLAKEEREYEWEGEESAVANVSKAVNRGVGDRLFKMFSDALGGITSWLETPGMTQSRR